MKTQGDEAGGKRFRQEFAIQLRFFLFFSMTRFSCVCKWSVIPGVREKDSLRADYSQFYSLFSVNEWSCLTHLFVVQTHLLYPDFSCCLCLLTSSSCYCPPSHSSSSLPRDSPSQSMAWYTRTKCSETTYQRNGWRDREKKRLWNLFPVMFRESFTSFVKCRVNKVSLRWDGKGKECACESFIVLLSICLSVKIERKKRRSFKGWNQSARYTEKTVYTVCICRISFFSSQTKKKYILKKRKTR